MKTLGESKVLCALLAVLAIGLGVQTYYLVKVHQELDALEEGRAAADGQPAGASGLDQSLAGTDPFSSHAVPFDQLGIVEARMNGLLDELRRRFDRGLGGSLLSAQPYVADGDPFLMGSMGLLGPRADLQDLGDSYELLFDIPGAEESDVKVRTEQGMLVVEGARNTSVETTQPGSYVRRERHVGRFERRLSLPADADPTSLRTEYEDGVLHVTLDKSKSA